MLKIDKIKIGMKVASYRALCRLLEEPIKGGDAKTAQLKEFSRYCKFIKSGNAFLIEEIYEVPREQRDGRQKYLYLIEPILLNYFSKSGRVSQELSWYKWFLELGMVDPRIYDEEVCKDELEFWNASPYSLFRLKNLAKNKMQETLTSALKNMKRRGLINYEEHWRIVTRDAITKVATEDDVQYIKRVHRAVLEEIGAKNMSALGLSPKLYQEFVEKSHKVLYRGGRWRSVFKEVRIEVLGNAADRYEGVDADPLRKELNQKVCAAVKKMAYRADEKQKERMMEAWEKDGENYVPPRFALPLHFTWDVEVLVDQLMIA